MVELNDGQTFAIAGLLNNNITAQKDVTPLLGDIPVLGTLFRSVRYQRRRRNWSCWLRRGWSSR